MRRELWAGANLAWAHNPLKGWKSVLVEVVMGLLGRQEGTISPTLFSALRMNLIKS